MNILRLLFELFILYLLYNLIFNFIIPIYKATKQVKEKFAKMQQNQKPHMDSSASSENYREDYIEFEEVK